MSFRDGRAAINLEMPEIIPRYESGVAEYHWRLVKEVTGIDINVDSPEDKKLMAASSLIKNWDYGIYLASIIQNKEFGSISTNMGHSVYAEKGRDFDNRIYCPFETVEDVFNFDPWDAYGEKNKTKLINRFNCHYRELCDLYPDTVNTTGIYITLMTGMIYIFGWDLLLTAIGVNSNRFGEVITRYADWMQQYYDALAESEAEVVYSHDDIVWTEGPFLDPEWYTKYIFPNYEKFWAPLKKNNKKIIYVGDGNYTKLACDIAACGNSGFWFEIFTDLEYMVDKFGDSHVIIGNADSRILTFGSKEDIRLEVERCLGIGKKCPGYFMCFSGGIPPNVPVENAIFYNEVYKELRQRNKN
jgi:hypothetical protein